MTYHLQTATVLAHLYSDARPMLDYIVEQNANAEIVISHWDAALGQQPTPEEIEAAYPLALAAAQRAAIPSITRAQAKAALIITGLIDQVQPAIDAIPDSLQRALAQNDWDERLHFERSNPTLAAMASALGMTDAQLDDLFALAATL